MIRKSSTVSVNFPASARNPGAISVTTKGVAIITTAVSAASTTTSAASTSSANLRASASPSP